MLFGVMEKAFWEWKVFVAKFKWNTLTWSIYSSVMWGLLFTVWNKEIIQPLSYCACVWERDTQSAFPLNEISWLRLIRSGYATCSELNYIVPGDVTSETTTIPGTCYTYWHGELMISNFWRDMIKSFFFFFSICPIFHFFLPLFLFLLKGRLDKRVFENVSRNHANTHLTRHLQVTSWSKIQDTILHTKSRIINNGKGVARYVLIKHFLNCEYKTF
jgi:hypothetical protein